MIIFREISALRSRVSFVPRQKKPKTLPLNEGVARHQLKIKPKYQRVCADSPSSRGRLLPPIGCGAKWFYNSQPSVFDGCERITVKCCLFSKSNCVGVAILRLSLFDSRKKFVVRHQKLAYIKHYPRNCPRGLPAYSASTSAM